MKTLKEAYAAADKGPVVVDNNLMLTTASGVYLASIDGSEGKKWRLSAALLAHCFNHLGEVVKALERSMSALGERKCECAHGKKCWTCKELEKYRKILDRANRVKEIGE